MRAVQSATGNFSFLVSEFLRVSIEPLSKKTLLRDVPELQQGSKTESGVPVMVQILGGDPDRMALSAEVAVSLGAPGIDINFGCPAPTVNRHDGGATLLKYPHRIREIVAAVRAAVPSELPVSAKLRLGWDRIEDIYKNAEMAAMGGASWITIHARTRLQGYAPPVFSQPIGHVREQVHIPVIANGDIWTLDDFHRCQDASGGIHFMIGRGALANPILSYQIASELGFAKSALNPSVDWLELTQSLVFQMDRFQNGRETYSVKRIKQWLRFAALHGEFTEFDRIKRAETLAEIYTILSQGVWVLSSANATSSQAKR
jgi:tRNA-dihydrouridine synthase C